MTETQRFGSGRRESHDASPFYRRGLASVEETTDRHTNRPEVENEVFCHSAETMPELPDDSVALVVTSPPYHVGNVRGQFPVRGFGHEKSAPLAVMFNPT